MIVPVPIDEFRNTDVDGRGGFKSQVTLDGGNIGIGVADVARLHRQQDLFGGAAASLFDQLDHPAQFLGAAVADIVEAVRTHAAAGFFEPVIRRRIVIGRDHPSDD